MSTFSFSHQFSQHWMTTLPAVKNAIIQELDDIATLLHPDAVLDDYKFSVPNLDTHVEDLITQENARLAKRQAEYEEKLRLENERLEQERLALELAENARLEQERREQMRLENERLEQIRLEKERLEQQRLTREKREQEKTHQPESKQQEVERIKQSSHSIASDSVPPIQETATPAKSSSSISHTITQKTAAPLTNLKESPAISDLSHDDIKQEITANLTRQIEDYIQESIQIIRDDLRPWLEAEVTKQLAQRLQPK